METSCEFSYKTTLIVWKNKKYLPGCWTKLKRSFQWVPVNPRNFASNASASGGREQTNSTPSIVASHQGNI